MVADVSLSSNWIFRLSFSFFFLKIWTSVPSFVNIILYILFFTFVFVFVFCCIQSKPVLQVYLIYFYQLILTWQDCGHYGTISSRILVANTDFCTPSGVSLLENKDRLKERHESE